MALAPTPPVIDPATVVDPCSNTFAINWTNPTVVTSIIATLDGVLLANLPGEATSMSVTLDALGTQQLCLTPVADGVNGASSCIDITAEGVATTSPTVVDISIDPATYLATIQWDSPTQMGQWDVTIDGVPVASLPGSTLEVTIPIENSGPFTVCVGGNTICDDAIVPTCGEAIAPQRFQRGDTNANGGLDLGDVVQTLNIVFGGSQMLCMDATDCNDDGLVDITDAVALVNYLFVGGEGPAAPTTECGADLTPDSLDCVSFTNCP